MSRSETLLARNYMQADSMSNINQWVETYYETARTETSVFHFSSLQQKYTIDDGDYKTIFKIIQPEKIS
ncbi:hypothetical protein KMW28_27030 [Flammeovirga yaeyamensis]|uniref:Uncharacterized protein n=1 Tax=Flammeovirga yaeyamensis TaxID=367791 RepID=A0AAX1NAG1_9BACT|nr:hypothetical protein [Flammeovirga yaeyamensis]MBB3700069.1 hypothetical protein [Flammeovirga yaeyamensis]NMF37497.1 hypothetical protein [Flammeovirga yaeyamensis]QWG04554.1 hypothetical protein KMW28_27030 [Flammeovirga yaeyamensis]